MPNTQLKVGTNVPISLELFDGDVNQYPRGIVYERQNAVPLATIDLEHLAKGLYEPDTLDEYVMPNKNEIKVVYIVYSDAGHLTENTNYHRAIDVFVKAPVALDEVVADHLTAGSLGWFIKKLFQRWFNRRKHDKTDDKMKLYDDDSVSVLYEWPVKNKNGDVIDVDLYGTAVPAEHTKAGSP